MVTAGNGNAGGKSGCWFSPPSRFSVGGSLGKYLAVLLCLLLLTGCGERIDESEPDVAPSVAPVVDPVIDPVIDPVADPIFDPVVDQIVTMEEPQETLSLQIEPVIEEAEPEIPAVPQYTLTYTSEGNGSIDGANPQSVAHGSEGSPVVALPAAGHHFLGWSDGGETARRIERNVTADLAVTAEFAINRYTLTYTADEHGAVEGASPQVVEHGGDAEPVVAIADQGYHFTAWSDGGATARRVERKVTGDLAVSALFAVNTYRVGGSVSGLIDGTEVVLQNHGGDNLRITADGSFEFAGELLDTQTYLVTVQTQPFSPNQTCTVSGGSGAIAAADVTDIAVSCTVNSYTIGGTISGLPEADRLILQNNGADELIIDADGDFTFALALEDHSAYQVTVASQIGRPNWTCAVENEAGTLAGQAVKDVLVTCYVETVLQAAAGINMVKLSWNSRDFGEVSFNLCRAREDFTAAEFGQCRNLRGGLLERGVNSSHIASRLLNDISHRFMVEVLHANGRRTYSEMVAATPFGGLNDTGIDWCGDDSHNRFMGGTKAEKSTSCETLATTHPRQDGHRGRDAAARGRGLIKTGSGTAGFDFTRICANGEAAGTGRCPPNPMLGDGPNNWACTRDNVTGLLWEVKTEGGQRDASHTYSWYNPAETSNGGEPGRINGGSCPDGGCDTHAYLRAVNELGLCGTNDWRLPTRKELLSIVDNGRYDPAIDTDFFPHTAAANYWSSSPSVDQQNSAWQVYFHYGESYPVDKKQADHLRLVQGRTVTFGFENP